MRVGPETSAWTRSAVLVPTTGATAGSTAPVVALTAARLSRGAPFTAVNEPPTQIWFPVAASAYTAGPLRSVVTAGVQLGSPCPVARSIRARFVALNDPPPGVPGGN